MPKSRFIGVNSDGEFREFTLNSICFRYLGKDRAWIRDIRCEMSRKGIEELHFITYEQRANTASVPCIEYMFKTQRFMDVVVNKDTYEDDGFFKLDVRKSPFTRVQAALWHLRFVINIGGYQYNTAIQMGYPEHIAYMVCLQHSIACSNGRTSINCFRWSVEGDENMFKNNKVPFHRFLKLAKGEWSRRFQGLKYNSLISLNKPYSQSVSNLASVKGEVRDNMQDVLYNGMQRAAKEAGGDGFQKRSSLGITVWEESLSLRTKVKFFCELFMDKELKLNLESQEVAC